ncbi:LacI family transcriptional regulator [Microbacterium sp. cx-55]|uniref:LacI family DNA-binding transcriptional regulator n=1 Tax=Microbacterium sp. cx-55 TaxID=2875948 RepID=UPI001CC14567|nr:LacI family DNA-binding transcriptional regulator [Microbacterium sp. cx-55]MBZ4488205.1 LacI family transcriptional regulator [Microbacterium sp. cx-55]UGB34867.1 LacI family transcriptional regulator [Microbacterium sp. cx-55]
MDSPSSVRRRSTVHDVARAAGVSRGTVSRVLNGGYVSDGARAAIEQAIHEVGYVPNTAARNLVRQRTQAVGLIVHEPHSLFLEDPNIGGILLGANTALSEADYQMVCLVVDTARDTDRVARYLSGGFVDGVVVISAREHDPITAVVSRLGLPAAYVGHPPDISGAWVGIDNRGAARAVTQRLRATGRRRIGIIAAALDRDSGTDRLAGFREALGEDFDPALVEPVPLYAFADGAAGMERLLARVPDLDGVFAASDAVAAGAMQALRAAGRRVPEDIGVVGFDDSAWARRTTPHLSTVHQPAEGLGVAAAQAVLAQLGGDESARKGIVLDAPIVWRGSA